MMKAASAKLWSKTRRRTSRTPLTSVGADGAVREAAAGGRPRRTKSVLRCASAAAPI